MKRSVSLWVEQITAQIINSKNLTVKNSLCELPNTKPHPFRNYPIILGIFNTYYLSHQAAFLMHITEMKAECSIQQSSHKQNSAFIVL